MSSSRRDSLRDDWLRLATTPGIGTALGARLIAHFTTPAAALAAGDAAWRALGVPERTRAALGQVDETRLNSTREWLGTPGHNLVTRDHARYPAALAELDPAPPWLYAVGDRDLLDYPAIAIVGSRNPTPAGAETARAFAAALARAGLVIVSGLARGIDAAAHEGALAADGMTVAVCGTGLDRVYPAANQDLARRDRRSRAAAVRVRTRHPAGARQFSAPQPHHRRPVYGHAGGRGRARFGLADHRAPGAWRRARGVRPARLDP